MSVSAPRRAPRLALGVLGLFVLGYQVYALGLQPIGEVANPPLEPLTRVELRSDGLVSQEFRVLANGFSGVTVFPAPGAATDGEVKLELHALPEDFPRVKEPVVPIANALVAVRDFAAGNAYEWQFEPIATSRGRAFRLDLSLGSRASAAGSTAPAGPSLWSTVDDRHRAGTLSVGGVQQWGDLAFSVTTSAPTAAANAVANLSRVAASGAGPLLWIGLLVVNGLLLAVWRQVLATSGVRTGVHEPLSTHWLVPPLDAATMAIALCVVAALAGLASSFGEDVDRVEVGAIDLLADFPRAAKRTTAGALHDAFVFEDVTIDGVRRSSLLALPFSRVTWTVDVPPEAVLRGAVALRPDAWTREGDGAMFRIGVAHDDRYDELFRRYVAPYASTADRRWFNVEIDLSPYAGARVNVIFNTEPGELGNAVSDATVWGAPRIVPRAARSGR